MKLTCKKENLTDALGLALRAASTRVDMPILSCVLVDADSEGLSITGADRDLAIKTITIPADVSKSGTAAVDARLFAEMTRRLDADEITFEVSDKNEATVQGGRARFNINGMPPEEFPQFLPADTAGVHKYEMPSAVLRDMIRRTIFSISTDPMHPTLCGELFEIKDGTLGLVAIDMFRISYATHALAGPDARAIIPGRACTELARILPGQKSENVTFYFTPTKAVFECAGFTLVSSLLEGEYMRYEQIFSDEFRTLVTINRTQFISALERVVLVASESKLVPMQVDVTDAEINLSSKSARGRAFETVNATIEGDPLDIYFNPRYFLEPLKAVETETVEIRFASQLSPATIKMPGFDDLKYLVVPMRPPV